MQNIEEGKSFSQYQHTEDIVAKFGFNTDILEDTKNIIS